MHVAALMLAVTLLHDTLRLWPTDVGESSVSCYCALSHFHGCGRPAPPLRRCPHSRRRAAVTLHGLFGAGIVGVVFDVLADHADHFFVINLDRSLGIIQRRP